MIGDVKEVLDYWVERTNRLDFIELDPISIPHRFTKKQDIEISAFFAAIMAWGNRTTIINKCTDLVRRMDNAPYEFVIHSSDADKKNLEGFVHRTLQDIDVLYLIDFLQRHYKDNNSLESAFFPEPTTSENAVQEGLEYFHDNVFRADYAPKRTRKHIATPKSGSACKRLNMLLRWMVRKDDKGVDFGLWTNINPSQLICPLDIHVQRQAISLGLLNRKQSDWKAAVELTNTLRKFDPIDPVNYDYALFGLGINSKV